MKNSKKQQYVPALRFHWLTPFYDVVVGITTREKTFKQTLIKQANFSSGQKVLDLACGTGTLAIWIKQQNNQLDVTGVDGDPAILLIAKKKSRELNTLIQFDQGLSYNLSYPSNCFDRVVSSLFFHHLSWIDKERTAKELLRVLKPGSELHIADWGRSSNIVMRGLFLFVQLLDGFKNTNDNVAGKLVTIFDQAGFVDIKETKTFSTIFGTMTLYQAVKPV